MMHPHDLYYLSALDHAEGSADRNGAGLDCANLDWAIAFVKFGDIAAGATTSIKLQQSDDDGSSDNYSDLAGTGITVAANDDNQTFAALIIRPRKRWIRVVVDKDAANNTEEMAWYVAGGARKPPKFASVTDALTVETHVSPAEGTA